MKPILSLLLTCSLAVFIVCTCLSAQAGNGKHKALGCPCAHNGWNTNTDCEICHPGVQQSISAPTTVRSRINESGPTPPPGTIGKTFQIPSRPVPVEKHPRVGMVDVHVEGAYEVIVHDMNEMRIEATIEGFRDVNDENVWHFETQPLYPGLDHIYRVQATFREADGTERKQAKYLRLIMGRVVELKF